MTAYKRVQLWTFIRKRRVVIVITIVIIEQQAKRPQSAKVETKKSCNFGARAKYHASHQYRQQVLVLFCAQQCICFVECVARRKYVWVCAPIQLSWAPKKQEREKERYGEKENEAQELNCLHNSPQLATFIASFRHSAHKFKQLSSIITSTSGWHETINWSEWQPRKTRTLISLSFSWLFVCILHANRAQSHRH